jgi:hypothetical protein
MKNDVSPPGNLPIAQPVSGGTNMCEKELLSYLAQADNIRTLPGITAVNPNIKRLTIKRMPRKT